MIDLLVVCRFALHGALAFVLFVGVNWLGPRSKAFGYVSLHAVPRASDPPSTVFNVVFRAAAPVALVLLTATALYAVGWDPMVEGIWAVPVYYFGGSLVFNLALGRWLILNWVRELGQAALSIGTVALLYKRVIEDRDTLMPDAEAIVAELWIIVALFIYAVLNGVKFEWKGSIERSDRYIESAYERYRATWGEVVSAELPVKGAGPDPFVESVVYAVMIYEGFNRPPRVQRAERWIQRVWPGRPRTLGPMQVRSAIPMTDEQSVRVGVRRVAAVIAEAQDSPSSYQPSMYDVAHQVYQDYNPGERYAEDVAAVHDVLIRQHYPALAEALEGSYGSYAR
ncbi:hypothetical protein [Rubrivirga litoralis]|uniref:Uncharacterized protein n=1 Tax=Rubrivirga litoralis TaxID=3075598 RepID=A0ABU3BQ93_9BACT|nr:hypothetical protein [Rubrivirga sp. F394]MDT0631430.1 hypothetical protein [Rubrivirga sp. F394]